MIIMRVDLRYLQYQNLLMFDDIYNFQHYLNWLIYYLHVSPLSAKLLISCKLVMSQSTTLDMKTIQEQLIFSLNKLEQHVNQQIQQRDQRSLHDFQTNLKSTLLEMLNALTDNNWTLLQSLVTTHLGEDSAQLVNNLQRRTVSTKQIKHHAPVESHQPQKNTQAKSVPKNPPQNQKGGGLLGKFLPFIGKKKQQGNFTPMYLPQKQQKFYFDKQLGRFIFQGEQIVQEAPPPPPPKRQELKKEPTTGNKTKSQVDSMVAPPTINLRKNRKGGKQKVEMKQPIASMESEIASIMTFSDFKIQLHETFKRIQSQLSNLCPVQVTDENLQDEVFQLMKDSYQMLLRTNEWNTTHVPHLVINRLDHQTADIQQVNRLKIALQQLQNQVEMSNQKILSYDQLCSQKDIMVEEQTEMFRRSQQDLQNYKSKYQLQLKTISEFQNNMVQKQDQEQKLSNLEEELRRVVKQLNQKNHIIKLLQENEAIFKHSMDAIFKQQKIIATIDQCLQAESSLMQRIKSKEEKLLRNQQQPSQIYQISKSSKGFLQMIDMFGKVANHTHSTLSVAQIENQNLTQKVSELSARLESTKSQYEAKISNLTNIVTKQKATLDSFKIDSNDSNQKLQNLKRDKLKLEKQIERIKHDASFGKGLLEQSNNKFLFVSKKSETQAAQIQNLTYELQVLRNQHSELESKNNELSQLLTQIDNQKNGFQEKVRQLQDVVERKNESESQLASIRQCLRNESKRKEEIQDQLKCLKQKCSDLQLMVSKLKVEAQESGELLQSMDNQLKNKDEELSSANNQLINQNNQLLNLKSQLQDKLKQLVDKNNQLTTKDQEIKSKQGQLADATNYIRELEQIYQQKQGNSKKREDQIERIRQQYTQQLILKETEANTLAESLSRLQEQFKLKEWGYQNSLQIKDKQIEEMTQLLAQIQSQIQAQKTRNAEFANSFNHIQEQKKMIQQLKQEIQQQKLKIQKQKQVIKEQTHQTLIHHQQTNKQLNKMIIDLQATYKQLEHSNSQLKSQATELKEHIERLQKNQQAISQNATQYHQQLKIMKQQEQKYIKELEQRQQLINVLQDQMQTIQASKGVSTQELNELREKLSAQQFQIQQTRDFYTGKVNEFQQRIGQLVEEKLINTSNMAEINNKYQTQLQNQKQNSNLIINQLRLQKKQLETTLQSLQQWKAKSEKEIEQLLQLLDENQGAQNKFEQSQSRWTSEVANKEETINKLEKQQEASNLMIGQLNEYLKSIKEREAMLQEKIRSLEIQNRDPKQAQFKKINDKMQSLLAQNEDLLKQKVELLRQNEALVAKLADVAKPITPISFEKQQNKIQKQILKTQEATTKSIPKQEKDQKMPIQISKPNQIVDPQNKPPLPQAVPIKKSGLMSALSSIFLTNQEQSS